MRDPRHTIPRQTAWYRMKTTRTVRPTPHTSSISNDTGAPIHSLATTMESDPTTSADDDQYFYSSQHSNSESNLSQNSNGTDSSDDSESDLSHNSNGTDSSDDSESDLSHNSDGTDSGQDSDHSSLHMSNSVNSSFNEDNESSNGASIDYNFSDDNTASNTTTTPANDTSKYNKLCAVILLKLIHGPIWPYA